LNLNRSGADLCQKIRDNDRLTRADHSEQDAVLRYELRTGVFKDLERIKWYLWHGSRSDGTSREIRFQPWEPVGDSSCGARATMK
jgi:hypothetical protein